MSFKLFDFRMHNGLRNFADLPKIVSFDELRDILKKLNGAKETGFVTDRITEVWLDFEYREHNFSVNNQSDEYWFFVEITDCPDEIMLEVIEHFQKFLN